MLRAAMLDSNRRCLHDGGWSAKRTWVHGLGGSWHVGATRHAGCEVRREMRRKSRAGEEPEALTPPRSRYRVHHHDIHPPPKPVIARLDTDILHELACTAGLAYPLHTHAQGPWMSPKTHPLLLRRLVARISVPGTFFFFFSFFTRPPGTRQVSPLHTLLVSFRAPTPSTRYYG